MYHQNTQQQDVVYGWRVFFFNHFVYWNSRFVIMAPIAMETGLNPKPAGIRECMSVCSLPFTATSRKHCTNGWRGDSTSLGWLENTHTFKWFCRFPAASHTCCLQTHCKSLVSHTICSTLLLCLFVRWNGHTEGCRPPSDDAFSLDFFDSY